MKKLFFFACLMMTAFLLQAAPVFADCSNTVSPTSMTIGATTRAAKFNVQASSKYDCSWSFQIPDQPCSWLRTSASCDISTEEKSFLIITDANTDRQSRTCSFQVCEQTITVIQEGEASQNTVYLPHITGGENDWKDLLEVDNTYSSALEYTITLYDADGNQIYNQTRSIAALSYQSLELKELAVNASSGMISYVAASSDLLFRVGYENLSGGGVADFVLAADAYTDTAFAFPNFSATVEWKGAAMMNTGESAATVTLEAFNAAGGKARRHGHHHPGQGQEERHHRHMVPGTVRFQRRQDRGFGHGQHHRHRHKRRQLRVQAPVHPGHDHGHHLRP